MGDATREALVRRSTRRHMPIWPSPASAIAPFTYRAVTPGLFDSIVSAAMHAGTTRISIIRSQRAER